MLPGNGCNEVLRTIGEKVGIAFGDVESGRKAPAKRGKGSRNWTHEVVMPADAVILEVDRPSRK